MTFGDLKLYEFQKCLGIFRIVLYVHFYGYEGKILQKKTFKFINSLHETIDDNTVTLYGIYTQSK